MPKLIPLTQGKFAIVDTADYEWLSQRSWCIQSKRYAATRKGRILLLMHRMILDAKPGEEVDHRDGDGFNNQRSNLRKCTRQQNVWNTRRFNRHGYRGITQDRNKFVAQLRGNGAKWRSRPFDTPAQAAQAYNEQAVRRFGEFAILNDIPAHELTEEYWCQFVRRLHAVRPVTRRNTTGIHGVWYNARINRWIPGTTFGGTSIKICSVEDKDEAAYIHDQVQVQLRGNRARLNTPFEEGPSH